MTRILLSSGSTKSRERKGYLFRFETKDNTKASNKIINFCILPLQTYTHILLENRNISIIIVNTRFLCDQTIGFRFYWKN